MEAPSLKILNIPMTSRGPKLIRPAALVRILVVVFRSSGLSTKVLLNTFSSSSDESSFLLRFIGATFSSAVFRFQFPANLIGLKIQKSQLKHKKMPKNPRSRENVLNSMNRNIE